MTSITNSEPTVTTNAPSRVARRGDQWMEENELRGHLAALMKLENVAVLLGAGASCGSLGGQTMRQLWDNFCSEYEESHGWLVEYDFLESKDSIPNIEQLADTLEIARLEWERTEEEELGKLQSVQADVKRAIVKAALLQEDWWEDSSSLRQQPDQLSDHRTLLQKLIAARQPGQSSPWLFTTNYDLALEWAAESIGLKVVNGFSGVASTKFSLPRISI